MQPQRDALEALSPDLKELGLELLDAYDWAVEQWASGKGSPELIGALDQKMKPTLGNATEMQRLRRVRPEVCSWPPTTQRRSSS